MGLKQELPTGDHGEPMWTGRAFRLSDGMITSDGMVELSMGSDGPRTQDGLVIFVLTRTDRSGRSIGV